MKVDTEIEKLVEQKKALEEQRQKLRDEKNNISTDAFTVELGELKTVLKEEVLEKVPEGSKVNVFRDGKVVASNYDHEDAKKRAELRGQIKVINAKLKLMQPRIAGLKRGERIASRKTVDVALKAERKEALAQLRKFRLAAKKEPTVKNAEKLEVAKKNFEKQYGALPASF